MLQSNLDDGFRIKTLAGFAFDASTLDDSVSLIFRTTSPLKIWNCVVAWIAIGKVTTLCISKWWWTDKGEKDELMNKKSLTTGHDKDAKVSFMSNVWTETVPTAMCAESSGLFASPHASIVSHPVSGESKEVQRPVADAGFRISVESRERACRMSFRHDSLPHSGLCLDTGNHADNVDRCCHLYRKQRKSQLSSTGDI